MAITVGVHGTNDSFNALTATVVLTPTAGSTLLAFGVNTIAAGTTLTIADGVNTWVPRTAYATTSGTERNFSATGVLGTPTTIVLTSSVTDRIGLAVVELIGAGGLDSANTSTDLYATGTSTSPLAVSVTPSQDNCAIIGMTYNANQASASAAGSYTLLDNSTNLKMATVYLIQTTAGASQAAATIVSHTWDMSALVVQASGGGGGGTSWGALLSDTLNQIIQV